MAGCLQREGPFRVFEEAPGFRPGPRERETLPCVQGGTRFLPLAPVIERRFCVYKEAPGFRPGLRL